MAAASIEARPGTLEFFKSFDHLRQEIEPIEVQETVYAFDAFPGKTVLEVGCGNGYVLSRYARYGARSFGVDLTSTGTDLSRRRFALEELSGRFVQADAEYLPFRGGTFDLAVSVGVLHHLPNIQAAVAEIYRLLKPGGMIVLMLYHRNSVHYRVLYPLYGLLHPAFRGNRPADVARQIDGAGNPIGRAFTRREVRKLLAPFRDVRLFVRSLPIRPLRNLPGGRTGLDLLSRWVGWFLYARAVK
ncbi:MAG TPA: class I SAM-dependent methyltransferase [Candidatus Methylomirabilis sp.]|nr:class I SAM-dependent methyltransferase [Candidatus Methylomirabilis sp.]